MAYLFNPTTGKLDAVTDPAGSDTQLQFNDGGIFGASANLFYNKTTSLLTNKGDINLDDGGSFTTTLQTITATANRTISFPDATGTLALIAGSSGQLIYNNAGVYAGVSTMSFDGTSVTLAGRLINSYTSLASAPAKTFTGSWFTGGTATTTKPHFLIEPSGATSTAWSTSGTGIGVNAASGFAGRLIDLQVNGTSQFSVSSAGIITASSLAGVGSAGAITSSGLTMATSRLLGRTTASTGAVQEISVGTGLTLSGGTLNTSAPSTKTLARFTARDNQPPAANFATLDTRNSVSVLEFDDTTQESANFINVIPEGANLTSGLLVRIWWMGDTATSGNVRWGAAFEASGTDMDADSFDVTTEVTSAANATSGIESIAEITCTAIDSLAAGQRFRLRIARIAADATNDTMTGDAQVVAVEVRGVA